MKPNSSCQGFSASVCWLRQSSSSGSRLLFGQTGSAGSSLLALLGEKAETKSAILWAHPLRLETCLRVATSPATSFPRPAPAVAAGPSPAGCPIARDHALIACPSCAGCKFIGWDGR